MPTPLFMLAAFVNTGLMTAGAVAVALPIAIHLLARRRFKRIRWAAIEFLLQAQRRNRRRMRLEEWILLALRCLAVLLIGVLLGRPFVAQSGLAGALGGTQRTERVFVLDDSFSMSYVESETGESSFSRLKPAATKLVESLRHESPDDTVTVLRLTAMDEPIASQVFLNEAQSDDLLSRIEALSCSQRRVELRAAMEDLVKLLERSPGIGGAVFYIISDFQKVDWLQKAAQPHEDGRADAAQAGGVLAPLAQWASKDRPMRILLVNAGASEPANTAVVESTIEGGRLVAGTHATLRSKVVHYSSRPREDLAVEVHVGPFAQPRGRVAVLGPRQLISIDVEVGFLRPGDEFIRASLPTDGLALDDTRYLATEISNAIRVLLVNGEPSSETYDDEVAYLATALRPEGEVFSGNEVSVMDETQFDGQDLQSFHVVVLANVYRVSDPMVEALESFVRGGGGLIVMPGDQADAELYNATLYREGEGLLPARLGEIVGVASAAHLVVVDRLHPAVRRIAQEGDPLGLGMIPFFRFFSSEPYEGAEGAEGAAPRPRASARVVARFDDQDEHPAIVERRFGLGTVLLVTTAADKEWHLWPDHPTYLPAMIEMVAHVARPSRTTESYRVGQGIDLEVDPARYAPDVAVRTPAYPAEQEVFLTAVPSEAGRGLTVSWEHTDRAGVYQFVLRAHEGGSVTRLVAVNVDAQESDLEPAREDELRQALSPIEVEYAANLEELSVGAAGARTEFWQMALAAVFLALMTEQFLAFRWGRRG